jgi:arsenate reductase
MKKARIWLQQHDIDYQFHDFKKQGLDATLLDGWIKQVGWETLLNRRGMMWRKLSDAQKQNIDAASARQIMLEMPGIIKRPVLSVDGKIHVGFNDSRYQEIFNA